MTTPSGGRFLFGGWNSALWTLDLTNEEGVISDTTLLPTGQVTLLLPVAEHLTYRQAGEEYRIEPGSAALVDTRRHQVRVEFPAGANAILIGIQHATLAAMLEPFRPGLAPGVRDLVYGTTTQSVLPARPEIAMQIIPALRHPAVSGVARAFWYESQFKALIAMLCFVPARGEGEFFCSRQKRLARVRVARAKARLESRLDESFDLGRLASEVGCSASYLSRTFSSTVGMTISQYLRKRRVEKAAELLLTGRYNVSEVALEVGYQSLSHFSKAFQQVKGCLPSRYEAA